MGRPLPLIHHPVEGAGDTPVSTHTLEATLLLLGREGVCGHWLWDGKGCVATDCGVGRGVWPLVVLWGCGLLLVVCLPG